MFFFSWLLGEAKIAFYHAQDTISLLTKGGPQISLAELVKKATPPCWLNPFLFNGHLQTIWASTKHNNPPVSYKRKLFEAENPAFAGTFAVDFVVHEKVETSPGLSNGVANYTEEELQRLGSRDSKPMLICLHGLTGGSHEVYLRHVLYAITTTQDSWEACVINARGCARSKLTTATIFNARATWDLRQLVKWLRQKFPNRPLYAIGFSLGANILTNYVGEEGDDCMLKAAISVANPYNLELCDRQLRSTWIGLHVYTKTLGAAMRKLVSYHREVLSKDGRFDFDKVMATKYLYEFDRELQCPGWGYPTEGAYYRDASSIDAFLAVRIPFLALHAEDDPIASRPGIPYQEAQKNPFTVLCTTSAGGHLSWFEWNGGRWYVKPTVGFLKAMQEADDDDLALRKEELSKKLKPQTQQIAEYLATRHKLRYFDEPL